MDLQFLNIINNTEEYNEVMREYDKLNKIESSIVEVMKKRVFDLTQSLNFCYAKVKELEKENRDLKEIIKDYEEVESENMYLKDSALSTIYYSIDDIKENILEELYKQIKLDKKIDAVIREEITRCLCEAVDIKEDELKEYIKYKKEDEEY